jgi:hypothetical protein
MCISPSYVWVLRGPLYEKQVTNCRQCWQCKSDRVNNYVGRALAETSTSDWTVCLTLTYSHREDLADKVLTPEHVQDFIRALRDLRHYSLRYMVIGEYGKLKGRAHFHIILFGRGPKPVSSEGRTWPSKTNFHLAQWPHGHVYADWDMDEKAVRYVIKYLLKNSDRSQYWFSLSKKPPLGHEFFLGKSDLCIANQVLPSSFDYLPPGGQLGRPYKMSGATRRDFLLRVSDGLPWTRKEILARASEPVQDAFLAAWKWFDVKNGINLTFQELVQVFEDEQERSNREFQAGWQIRFDKLQERLHSYPQQEV